MAVGLVSEHEGTVHMVGPYWIGSRLCADCFFATCSCGWRGAHHADAEAAGREWLAHEREES